MAKRKGGDNKSEAIRQILTADPKAKPKKIKEELEAKGLTASTAFISTIKTKFLQEGGKKSPTGEAPRRGRPPGSGKKAAGRPRGRPPGSGSKAAPKTSGGSISFDGLLKVKDLVNQLGGLDKAKEALAALEQIVG